MSIIQFLEHQRNDTNVKFNENKLKVMREYSFLKNKKKIKTIFIYVVVFKKLYFETCKQIYFFTNNNNEKTIIILRNDRKHMIKMKKKIINNSI